MPPDVKAYDRIAEIVDVDPERKRTARERYKQYRERGCTMESHNLVVLFVGLGCFRLQARYAGVIDVTFDAPRLKPRATAPAAATSAASDDRRARTRSRRSTITRSSPARRNSVASVNEVLPMCLARPRSPAPRRIAPARAMRGLLDQLHVEIAVLHLLAIAERAKELGHSNVRVIAIARVEDDFLRVAFVVTRAQVISKGSRRHTTSDSC